VVFWLTEIIGHDGIVDAEPTFSVLLNEERLYLTGNEHVSVLQSHNFEIELFGGVLKAEKFSQKASILAASKEIPHAFSKDIAAILNAQLAIFVGSRNDNLLLLKCALKIFSHSALGSVAGLISAGLEGGLRVKPMDKLSRNEKWLIHNLCFADEAERAPIPRQCSVLVTKTSSRNEIDGTLSKQLVEIVAHNNANNITETTDLWNIFDCTAMIVEHIEEPAFISLLFEAPATLKSQLRTGSFTNIFIPADRTWRHPLLWADCHTAVQRCWDGRDRLHLKALLLLGADILNRG
jgi:hypothetical protein